MIKKLSLTALVINLFVAACSFTPRTPIPIRMQRPTIEEYIKNGGGEAEDINVYLSQRSINFLDFDNTLDNDVNFSRTEWYNVFAFVHTGSTSDSVYAKLWACANSYPANEAEALARNGIDCMPIIAKDFMNSYISVPELAPYMINPSSTETYMLDIYELHIVPLAYVE